LFHRPTGITVVSSKERSQYLNKAEALSDLRKKIGRKLKRVAPRIPTRIPESAKRKRLEKKRKISGKKELRRRVLSDE
jgi:ribosome-associated protein